MVGEAGIEPTTPGLEGRCSIRLSYSPAPILILTSTGPKRICQCSQRRLKELNSRRLGRAAGGQIDGDSQGHRVPVLAIWGEEDAAYDEVCAAATKWDFVEEAAYLSACGSGRLWLKPLPVYSRQ